MENFIKNDDLVTINEADGKVNYTFQCEYASEALERVPAGYINKTVCGCGLTTVAIKEPCHTIIAVPNVSLVKNKESQNEYLLGIDGDVTKEQVEDFVQQCQSTNRYIKIITTYDSLWKCEPFLPICHLVIDESDRMATYSTLKTRNTKAGDMDVITYMLIQAEKYKESVSFISATPIPAEELKPHTWIAELDQIVMHWAGEQSKNIIAIECEDIGRSLVQSLLTPLKIRGEVEIAGRTIKKIIVFYNSVLGNIDYIEKANLPQEDVYIICANSIQNDLKLKGYDRLETDLMTEQNSLRKFNFVTSTGFQGIDLYDDEAIAVLVSGAATDIKFAHCMMELNSDIKQASSRIRTKDNPLHNTCLFYYSKADLGDSMEKYLTELENAEQRIEHNCQTLNEYIETKDPRYSNTLQTFSYDTDAFCPLSLFDTGTRTWSVNTFPLNTKRYLTTQKIEQFASDKDITTQLEELGFTVEKVAFEARKFKQQEINKIVKAKMEEGENYKDITSYDLILQDDPRLLYAINQMSGTSKDTNSTRNRNKMVNLLSSEEFETLYNQVCKAFPTGIYTIDDAINRLKPIISRYPSLSKREIKDKASLCSNLREIGLELSYNGGNPMSSNQNSRVPNITIKKHERVFSDGEYHRKSNPLFMMLGRKHSSTPAQKPKNNLFRRLLNLFRKAS